MNKKGFTLIELLVVISIIGLLSSVVLASLNSARAKARDARRLSDIHQIQLALALYYDDNNNTYPPDNGYCFDDTTNSVITGPTKALRLYLPAVPDDPLSSQHYCYVGGTPTGGPYGIRYTRETKIPAFCYVMSEGGPATGWWGVSVCPN